MPGDFPDIAQSCPIFNAAPERHDTQAQLSARAELKFVRVRQGKDFAYRDDRNNQFYQWAKTAAP